MLNNFIITFLLIMISAESSANSWTIQTQKKVIRGLQEKSILEFKNPNKKSIIYDAIEEPFTFLDNKEVVINKTSFFVTTWAYGARSVLIRIFNPENGSANPICTAISDSYDPQIRIKDQYLEVEEVVSELKEPSKGKWKKCSSFPNSSSSRL